MHFRGSFLEFTTILVNQPKEWALVHCDLGQRLCLCEGQNPLHGGHQSDVANPFPRRRGTEQPIEGQEQGLDTSAGTVPKLWSTAGVWTFSVTSPPSALVPKNYQFGCLSSVGILPQDLSILGSLWS